MDNSRQIKRFFRKKGIYSILFLLFLFGYSGWIWWESEGSVGDMVPGKYGWIEWYGATQKLLGRQVIQDLEYWKDREGYLYTGKLWDYPVKEADWFADCVKKVQEQTKDAESDVLVLIPPPKYFPQKDASRYPSGMPAGNSNAVADRFVKQLQKKGISVLDYREKFVNSPMKMEDLFYRTDHHWTIPAAFAAFQMLVTWMNEESGYDLDPDGWYRSLENYQVDTYPAQFLGSAGRAVGSIYAGGLEDFTTLLPKEKQWYRWMSQSEEGEQVREGAFRDSLFVSEHLQAGNAYEQDSYSVYLNGVAYEDEILNLSNPDGPDILWIRDSFASPLAAFMAPLCHQMDLVWSLKAASEVESLLRERTYDAIIFCIYPDNLVKESFTGL